MVDRETTPNARAEPNPARVIARWLARTVLGALILGAGTFAIAGRLDWPMAWVYLASLLVIGCVSAFVVDPGLLAERMQRRHANQEPWDRALFGVYGTVTGFLVPLLAALVLRLGWPPEVPLWIELVALFAYLVGWAVNLWAMAENAYFSQVVRIQTDRGQRVIDTGPYRYVRHPGYTGGVLLTAAMPLVLGSAWALGLGVLGAALLVVRAVLEDRVLLQELEGYDEYARRVPYRLLPGIW